MVNEVARIEKSIRHITQRSGNLCLEAKLERKWLHVIHSVYDDAVFCHIVD